MRRLYMLILFMLLLPSYAFDSIAQEPALDLTKLSELQQLGKGRLSTAAINTPHARLAVAGNRGVALYDLNSLALLQELVVDRLILGLYWSPDGTKLTLTAPQHAVEVWGLETGNTERLQFLYSLAGTEDWLGEVLWSPDSQKLASKQGLWNAADGMLIHAFEAGVYFKAWLPDSAYLLYGDAQDFSSLQLWDVAKHEDKMRLSSDNATALSKPSLSPDGRYLAAVTTETSLLVWDIFGSAKPIAEFPHVNAVESLTWTTDSRYVLSRDETRIWVWEIGTGQLLHGLDGGGTAINSMQWSPDGGQLAVMSDDGEVRVWDVLNAQLRHVFTVSETRLLQGLWSARGDRLAVTDDRGNLAVWQVDNTQEMAVFEHTGTVAGMLWLADAEQVLAYSPQDTVIIWELGTGRKIHELTDYRRRCGNGMVVGRKRYCGKLY